MIELTEKPIDVAKALQHVSDPHCGAEVLFVGTTRQWTQLPVTENASAECIEPQTVETSHLIYEAHESFALQRLRDLAEEVQRKWPIRKLVVMHRIGRVDPTEPSVLVAVSSPHRAEAFEAGRWLIDTIKHEVPIWKQEHYVQGGSEWIHPTAGSCNCNHSG